MCIANRTAARLRATRAAHIASRADAATALHMASEGEASLADALGKLATAEQARADLAQSLARARVHSPLAGLQYVNPARQMVPFTKAA
jgi:DnaJ-domain-containing protein 1